MQVIIFKWWMIRYTSLFLYWFTGNQSMKFILLQPCEGVLITNENNYFLFYLFNSLGPRQNRRHFPDDIFKWNFLNENAWTSIKISLKFIPRDPINRIPALAQIMAWRRPGDKPLSEPMLLNLRTHICVTRPQWVYGISNIYFRYIYIFISKIIYKQ